MARRLLLDTNLTVLLVVGLYGAQYIKSHKRLQQYDQADFVYLQNMIAASSGLVFSPNVLTETSNLLRYVAEPLRSHLAVALRQLIETSTEEFVNSRSAITHRHFERLGLTDSVLLRLTESGAILVTDDLELYLAAESAGFEALNFAHVREQRANNN